MKITPIKRFMKKNEPTSMKNMKKYALAGEASGLGPLSSSTASIA
jgi:hypothetical protein